MIYDRQGNTMTGATPKAADLFGEALHAFNIYRGDPVAPLDEAIADAPAFAMAHILKAYLYGLATEPEAAAEARAIACAARDLPMNAREQSHMAALKHMLAGNWTDAATCLDRHSADYPHDLVALQCGHLMDFYRANARNLRDRIARTLPRWAAGMEGHSIVLGMYAFGLEEAGDYARAEEMGRAATEEQPLDCWAHHAVAHVLEMQGRARDGIAWMDSREPHWSGDGNFFQVHNWWHKALCHLELGQIDEVFRLYDEPIRGERSQVALDMLDASALLWRLSLAGHDVGGRWGELADAWDQHADGRLYPFNDWHAAMAWLGAGQVHKVDALAESYRRDTAAAPETTVWARQTGLPLIEGFRAFWSGDFQTAVEKLHPARYIANSFGGSHAQRDVIDWTLTEAALRGGMHGVGEALARERLALKPHSPVNQAFLRRAAA